MINEPLVSIIIPAFNASSWIEETISSVLEQEYKNFEVIVVNDGSTDGTEKILEKFNEIKIINKVNGGQSSARNVGIMASKGEYLAFVDSDDLWVKEKLKIQINELECSGLKWIYSDAIAFDSNSRMALFKFSEKSIFFEGEILLELFNSCFIPMPTVVVHRSVFEVVGLFNEKKEFRNREDWEMWLRIAAIYPIALIKTPLAQYRVHQSSVTGIESIENRLNGNILVLKEAAKRESNRLAPFLNFVISKLYFSAGRYFSLNGDYKTARKLSLTSIRYHPFWLPPYILWLIAPSAIKAEIVRKKINKFI